MTSETNIEHQAIQPAAAPSRGRRGRHRPRASAGLTLVELIVVVAILAIVSSFIVPLFGNYIASGKRTAAQASLTALRDAIMGTPDKPGYSSDTGQVPYTLADLFAKPASVPAFNPATALGWRGPYLLNPGGQYTINNPANFIGGNYPASYGQNGDQAVLDPWQHPIVLQRYQSAGRGSPLYWLDASGSPVQVQASWDGVEYSRLISAGPTGTIDTSPADLTAASRGDDLVLFLNRADIP